MMARSPARWFLWLSLVGAGLWLGFRAYPRWHHDWQGRRAARFDADAIRSIAYPVTQEAWLEFDVPRHAESVRVLTNAAVCDLVPPATTREQPREGWRYAMDYQLLDRAGRALAARRYHFRASIVTGSDPDSGKRQPITWFRRSDWIPTMTRTIQLPLNTDSTARLRLRLAACVPGVQEVVVRVLARRERSDYDQPYAWSRASERARNRVSRASVYPPALLTADERRNLLRWTWSALPPKGLEGRDYELRALYQLEQTAADETEEWGAIEGLLLTEQLHHTLLLPPGPARVIFEFAPVSANQRHSPADVCVQWHPDTPIRGHVHRGLVDADPWTIEIPVNGGLLEIAATAPIVCRATWHGLDDTQTDQVMELDLALRPLGCYLAGPDLPLDYTITHLNGAPTPFRLDLRRLIREPPSGGPTAVPPELEPVTVRFSTQNAQGDVLRADELSVPTTVSVYDQASPSTMARQVTESASFYFAFPPDVARLQLEAPDDTVIVAAFTRPPELPRRQQLPEEQQSLGRFETEARSWFLVQPDAADLRVARNLAATVFCGVRPPERDEQILSGVYEWENFEPAGFWKGRFVLIPRDPEMPVRSESLSSIYGELEPNRDYGVQLRAEPDTESVEPRLVYESTSRASQDVQLWLDGVPWFAFRTRAARGEVSLPPIPLPHQPMGHTLRIDAAGTMRFLVSNLLAPESSLYSKRLACQFDQGALEFTVVKRTHGPENLVLRPFFPAGWSERVDLRVRIRGLPVRTGGPFESWTLADRELAVLPRTDQASLVLEQETQRVDGGQRCFLSLGADLPPGPYRVNIEMADPAPASAYAALYRTVAGRSPRWEVERTEAVPPLERSSSAETETFRSSDSATIPTSSSNPTERLTP